MAAYKNPYQKEEDYMLWELHEIRNNISEKQLSSKEINDIVKKSINKYNLKKVSDDELKKLSKRPVSSAN